MKTDSEFWSIMRKFRQGIQSDQDGDFFKNIAKWLVEWLDKEADGE